MATTDDTSGHRFVGRQFCAKSYNSHSIDHFMFNHVLNNMNNNEPYINSGNDPGANIGSIPIINTFRFDSTLAELLETLRLHIHDVLRLPLSVQTRSRLVSGYCDIDSRVKEMRLLLNPVDIAAALELLEDMQRPYGVSKSP